VRDDAKSKRARMDFVRKSWDIAPLTRPIDLHRKWSYVKGVRLQRGYLAWKQAEPKHIGNHWLFDGEIARQAILTRQQAEKGGRGILDEFVLLCDGSDKAILEYARTWGVLELCCHNLPAMSFRSAFLFVSQALCRGDRGACGSGIQMIRVNVRQPGWSR
jgi:hypothetical protein